MCRLMVMGDKYFYDNIGKGSKKLSGEYLVSAITLYDGIDSCVSPDGRRE